MEIVRKGYSPKQTSTTRTSLEPNTGYSGPYKWDKETESVVADMVGNDLCPYRKEGRYYTVRISLEEMRDLVSIIGRDGIDNCPAKVAEAFRPALSELIRIQNACVERPQRKDSGAFLSGVALGAKMARMNTRDKR